MTSYLNIISLDYVIQCIVCFHHWNKNSAGNLCCKVPVTSSNVKESNVSIKVNISLPGMVYPRSPRAEVPKAEGVINGFVIAVAGREYSAAQPGAFVKSRIPVNFLISNASDDISSAVPASFIYHGRNGQWPGP